MTRHAVVVGMLRMLGIGAVMIVVVRVRGSATGRCVNMRRRVVVALGGGSLKHECRGRDKHKAQRDYPGKGA